MVASSLSKSLLLLALGFSHQVVAACTRSVTAQQGDTCATLASQAGITVTDFLRSNPAVTSCSQLVAGGSYCVDGTADSGPELQVSTDGSCGQGVTCTGSRFGTCCSAHGFCGSTSDYCGDGCQAAFGTCGGGGGGETSAAGSVTVTVTTITGITQTSVVYQTSTITNVVTQTRTAATATVTQTVRTTATVPATATTTVTSTARVTSVVTNVRTSIIVTTSTSIITSVSTRTINLTSLSIDTITSTVLSTRVVTSAACNTTPTKTTTRVTTTTAAQGERPTLPGTPSYCRNYDEIEKNDSCRSIATRNNLSLLEFYQLNPSVSATILTLGDVCTPEFIEFVLIGLCQINCDALWEGYYVCVGR